MVWVNASPPAPPPPLGRPVRSRHNPTWLPAVLVSGVIVLLLRLRPRNRSCSEEAGHTDERHPTSCPRFNAACAALFLLRHGWCNCWPSLPGGCLLLRLRLMLLLLLLGSVCIRQVPCGVVFISHTTSRVVAGWGCSFAYRCCIFVAGALAPFAPPSPSAAPAANLGRSSLAFVAAVLRPASGAKQWRASTTRHVPTTGGGAT